MSLCQKLRPERALQLPGASGCRAARYLLPGSPIAATGQWAVQEGQ